MRNVCAQCPMQPLDSEESLRCDDNIFSPQVANMKLFQHRATDALNSAATPRAGHPFVAQVSVGNSGAYKAGFICTNSGLFVK